MFTRLFCINGRAFSSKPSTRLHSRSTFGLGVPCSRAANEKTFKLENSLLKTHTIPVISNQVQFRYVSNCVEVGVATFEEVKCLSRQSGKWLIDVREPQEVQRLGAIPSSVNIPLSALLTELAPKIEGAAYHFKKKYGRPFPTHNTELVFYCMSGHRSHQAAELAVAIGYKHVKNYKGSWNEWSDRILEANR